MTAPRRVCVFCSSNCGRESGYRRLAEALGRMLAARRIGIRTWAQLGLHAKPCALLDADG